MGPNAEPQLTPYDRVTYPSYTHPQTHPDRLAVLGLLFGVSPSPLTRCRVLEIGCGNGANLAPMSWALPTSEFVGIDLALKPIQRGQQMTTDLGLKNLQLVQGSVAEVNAEWGRFDYIIAHGFYSWVPADVRQHVLRVCQELLNPHGIAFISYNTFPGCHLRQMLREMLLFHVRGFAEPSERVAQSLALAHFLAEAQDTRDEYRLWMKAELERFQQQARGHIYHDDLAEVNEPLHFTQFVSQAAAHGLQYLGEADYFEMSDHVFKDSVREMLSGLASNRIAREQYLDFLKCRRFRQTLLCRREVPLRPEAAGEKIVGFLVGSAAVCIEGSPNLAPGVNCVFQTPKGAKCQTDLAAGKAALAILGERWPAPLPFSELQEQICSRLAHQGMLAESAGLTAENLSEFLLRLYAGGVVEFRSWLPPIASGVEERPIVHPVARWQAAQADAVASLFHIGVKVEDELGRSLLLWLDGTLDRGAIFEKVWSLLKSRKAIISGKQGEAEARIETQDKLEENLQKLARLGMLVDTGAARRNGILLNPEC